MKQSFYDTLGVPAEASSRRITRSFRQQLQAAHPSRGGDSERLGAVLTAYLVLSDRKRRRAYDEALADGTADAREWVTPAELTRAARRATRSKVREWTEAAVFALVIALILRTFVIQAFKIPSGSMEDTLLIGDHLLVNKFVYGMKVPGVDTRFLPWRNPERGDIIVFEFPADTDDPRLPFWQKRDFIKRVIGLPGDRVEIRDKQVFVNDQPFELDEAVHKDPRILSRCFQIGDWRDTYRLRQPNPGAGERDCMFETHVPDGHYFVLGDNRDFSHDSRFWGFVPMANIKGLAFIKYWSWDSDASLLDKIRFGRIGRLID